MSARGYKGKTLAILLNGQRIAAVRAKSVSHTKTPIDRSDEEKTGWRYLDPKADSRSVQMSVEGVATTNNFALLRDEWLGTSFSDVTIQHPDGNSEEAADGAFLQSLAYSGEHEGFVAYEASFVFSGLVTVGEIVQPVLTDIDPDSAIVDSEGFQMTLTGMNFQDGAVAIWEGTELTTTFVSSTSLLATIPDSLLDQVGSFDIHVENPDGGETNSLAFTVLYSPVVLLTNWTHEAVYKSIDGGETWETITTDHGWTSIAYSPDLRRWVVVSGAGEIYTSDDNGETWDEQTSGITQTIMAVEWAPHFGLFVAHARHLDESNPETFLYSEDGETWTEGSLDTPTTVSYSASRIASCPELGIALCMPQGQSNVRLSRNGKTWTTHSITPGVGGIALAYSPALELAVISDGQGNLLSSANGTTWTQRHDAGSVLWGTWSPDREEFLFGGSDEVLSSEDGVSWDAISTTVFSAQIDHGDMLWSRAFERYIGVARLVAANATQHSRSDDGASWTRQAGQTNSFSVVRIAQPRPREQVPPVLHSIDPDTVLQESGGFTLTLHGSGFTDDCIARIDGANLETTFVSATELTAAIEADVLDDAGTFSITVFSPGPGVTSNAAVLTVTPNTDPDFADVVALLHFDGSDESTTIVDVTGKTWTANGNAQLDTAQKKFGTASLALDGSGDSVSTSDHADFALGAEDFTIEGFVRFASTTGDQVLTGQWGNAGARAFTCGKAADGSILFAYTSNGSSITSVTGGWSPSAGTWHHIAFCREGANLRMFVDGVQAGSTHNIGATAIFNSNLPLVVGGHSLGANLNGHIDEFRMTVGTARYTENFTPPAAAFPNQGPD